MEKLNIAELLRDCPTGMELDSPIVDELYFDEVTPHMIKCFTKDKNDVYNTIYFHCDGTYLTTQNAKCVIFPKGKTTWEGFQRPFKDGDVVFTTLDNICIIKKYMGDSYISHCILINNARLCFDTTGINVLRYATSEEKQKLFKAIKDNGYRWNAETKTLEKLIVPKFKVGDIIQDIDTYKVKITEVNIEDECYGYESMILKGIGGISFSEQDNWELVPNKFDITTLKAFDRVLVRDNDTQKWTADLFSFFDKSMIYPYSCVGHYTNQCIPYNDKTKHLLGTTNDCDEYYKTWE